MEKHKILLSGPNISHNKHLINSLSTDLSVFESENYNLIESQIQDYQIDLLVLELDPYEKFDITVIDKIKSHFPNIKIIIINGKKDQRYLAKAFSFGANDVYRQPCNIPLLVERVHSLLISKFKS